MRTLAITQNTTLDGRVEMLGEWFDPQGRGDVADLREEQQRQSADADAFLVGRRTFEDLRGYWRDLEGDATGVSDYLNAVAKHVVSTTITDPGWAGTTVMSGDVASEVRDLKQADGGDIVCTGSIRLCHALVRAGLVDEYRLFTYPVVQGAGRRLFPDGYETSDLRLVETKGFRTGITFTRWATGA